MATSSSNCASIGLRERVWMPMPALFWGSALALPVLARERATAAATPPAPAPMLRVQRQGSAAANASISRHHGLGLGGLAAVGDDRRCRRAQQRAPRCLLGTALTPVIQGDGVGAGWKRSWRSPFRVRAKKRMRTLEIESR